jgi:hypothetical protein
LGCTIQTHQIAIHPEINERLSEIVKVMQSLYNNFALGRQLKFADYLVTSPVLSLSILLNRTVVKNVGSLQSSLVTIRNSMCNQKRHPKGEKKRISWHPNGQTVEPKETSKRRKRKGLAGILTGKLLCVIKIIVSFMKIASGVCLPLQVTKSGMMKLS